VILLTRLSLPMTISESYRYLREQLYSIYDHREAENIANLVIENITGVKKLDRLVNKPAMLSALQENNLHEYTSLLLLHHPVQYVLRQAWFYGMQLYVDDRVLIPRPETEELVEWIIKDNSNNRLPVSVIDMGTGSGCIPIALKKNIPTATVWAIDVSEDALNVAEKNAALQQAVIILKQADILDQEKLNEFPLFDVIVSNPPYIPLSDKEQMHANVLQYEPHLALFVENDDPLIFYKAIATFASKHLKENGAIYVEMHELLADGVKEIFIKDGFTDVIIKKDMQGKDRMIKAKKG